MSTTWGAVFDWDGVIVNSAAQHEESWEHLAHENQLRLPANHFKQGFGMKNEYIIPNILKWTDDSDEVHRLSLRKEELYREIIQKNGIEPLPGVHEFFDWLREHDVPRVVGSSTHRANIEVSLAAMGMERDFTALVTAEDVSHGKPDPEVFLKGAEKIGMAPERCVVFEDAQVGIQAGKAGGMRVIALETTHPRDTLTEADLVVKRLDEISPSLWDEWFGV
ncbi:MAG: HAD-IA family hydrolase [Verrucomicrobiota bacterium]